MMETNSQAFSKIYDRHTWKGRSLSGPGSDAERTREFRALLTKFMKDHRIQSVVDLGCGDWSYSQLIDWTGIRYTGIDTVDSVVEKNQRLHAQDNISFLCRDAAHQDLPPADLIIVKEVLQHLPSKDVQAILSKLPAFRYAILVNDVSHHIRGPWKKLWRWQSICPTNTDVAPGGYRLLALQKPPFSLPATPLLTYQNQYRNYRWEKEVLLWTRSKDA